MVEAILMKISANLPPPADNLMLSARKYLPDTGSIVKALLRTSVKRLVLKTNAWRLRKRSFLMVVIIVGVGNVRIYYVDIKVDKVVSGRSEEGRY